MPYSISLTQGYTFATDGTDKVTYAKLNQLGSPVVSLSGSLTAADISGGSITNSKIADDAIDGSKIADGAVGLDHLTSANQGALLAMSEDGWEHLQPGGSGQLLTSNGSGANLSWSTPETVANIAPSQITGGSSGQVLQKDTNNNPVWGDLADSNIGGATEATTPAQVSLGFGTASNQRYLTVNGSDESVSIAAQTGSAAHFTTDYFGVFDEDAVGGFAEDTSIGFGETTFATSSYSYYDWELTDTRLTALGTGQTEVGDIKGVGLMVSLRLTRGGYGGVFYRQGTNKWTPLDYHYDATPSGNVFNGSFHSNSSYVVAPVTGSPFYIRVMAYYQPGGIASGIGFKILDVRT